MSLKARLAVLYALSVFIILVTSAFTIYLLNESFRKAEFSKRLLLEAEESNLQFSGSPTLTADVIQALNQNAANSLPQENLIIYDSALTILYKNVHSPNPKISRNILNTSAEKGQAVFTTGEKEAVIICRHIKNKTVYVYASAYDIFGRRKNDNLKILLTSSVFGGILFSGLMAFFYVRQAIKPLEKLKEQIEKIDESNLTHRISVSKNNDEISQIAKKFNAMLERIQEAFEQRKNFVHHASHELRTPLANMLSQTESALGKSLTVSDYRSILFSLKEEQQDLIDLTNSLLALSRYEKMNIKSRWPKIRIDEVLYQIVDTVNMLWPEAVVTIEFETIPENEDYLVLDANESLIKSMVQNLIKNAIQYSDNKKVKVRINASAEGITMHFDNAGTQLSVTEQEKLFLPFFRGENAQNKRVTGLAYPLCRE